MTNLAGMGFLHRYVVFILVITLQIFAAQDLCAQSSEYEVKAGFIYNFLQFVEFENSASNSQIKICIDGSAEKISSFNALRNKTINGIPVIVQAVGDTSALDGCRAYFETEHLAVAGIAHKKRGIIPGILTIADDPLQIKESSIISFYIEDNKVRFAINLDNAELAKIKISSKLLSLAKVVRND